LTYSEAVRRIAGMSHFFNGTIYRPIEIDVGEAYRRIRVNEAKYFDYLDTSEVLAYQAAVEDRHGRGHRRARRYRDDLGSPFDLTNRVASLGVLTLTIRLGSPYHTFFLHRRDPTKVVVGSELFQVVPAGEYTPSDISREAVRDDLDLWRNIAREYAEEMLGREDAQGTGGKSIDFDDASPFRELAQARRDGNLSVRALGIGIDPLSWKPELLTVAIFGSDVFDVVFKDIVLRSDEGTLIVREGVGLPFTKETIDDYATSRSTRPGAQACLTLAWRHRRTLGLA
jgi:hypothetical protein